MSNPNERQVGGSHYQKEEYVCECGRRHQHWDIAWGLKWDSFMYPITKYLWRWRRKNRLEDLRKAKHYLEKYILVLEKEEGVTHITADDIKGGTLDADNFRIPFADNTLWKEVHLNTEPGPEYVNQDPDVPMKNRR